MKYLIEYICIFFKLKKINSLSDIWYCLFVCFIYKVELWNIYLMVYVFLMFIGMRSSCEVIIKLNMEKVLKGKIFIYISIEIEYRIVLNVIKVLKISRYL